MQKSGARDLLSLDRNRLPGRRTFVRTCKLPIYLVLLLASAASTHSPASGGGRSAPSVGQPPRNTSPLPEERCRGLHRRRQPPRSIVNDGETSQPLPSSRPESFLPFLLRRRCCFLFF